MELEVKLSTEGARMLERLDREYPRKALRVIQRAIRRACNAGQARAFQLLRKQLGLPRSVLEGAQWFSRRRPLVYMSLSPANAGVMKGAITFNAARIPLQHFGAKTVQRAQTIQVTRTRLGHVQKYPMHVQTSGVSYKIGDRGRKIAPRAFMARMSTGHEGAFRRKPASRTIYELKGPSIAHLAKKTALAGPVIQRMREIFEKRIKSGVGAALTGGGHLEGLDLGE